MKKNLPLRTLILALGCATAFSFSFSQTPKVAAKESEAHLLLPDFVSVAKKAIPAVVFIRVKSTAVKTANPLSGGDDLFGGNDFNEQFWNRFFGLPSPGKTPSQPQLQMGQASGFLISADGLILTNGHVIENAQEVTVVLNDEREFTAKIIGQDPNTDIALIKIDAKDLPFLPLGDSDALEVGQWVAAIGNPYGLQASLTTGVVSAKGRNNLELARIEDFIQTDAPINRGNSGGPLLNLNAEAVGINTAIVTNMASGGSMGIGFAIPSNIVKKIKDQLVAHGVVSRGFLGVSMQKIDQDLAKAFKLSKAEGALVAEVSPGSPAEKAGIKQGDVILKYNQMPVLDVAALRNAIGLMPPGTTLQLDIQREGKPVSLTLEIAEFPTTIATGKGSFVDSKLGITVDNMTQEAANGLGMKELSGVLVKKVEEGSLAAWAGLRKGAVILEVNQKKVTNVDQYNAAIQATEKSKPILFLIRQGDAVRFVSIKAS